MLAWSSGGRSASVVFAWIAFRSRSKVFGRPFEAAFKATTPSITAA
jgi:hypothetical protein